MQNILIFSLVIISLVFTAVLVGLYVQIKLMKERWSMSNLHQEIPVQQEVQTQANIITKEEELAINQEKITPVKKAYNTQRNRRSQKELLAERAMIIAAKEALFAQQFPLVSPAPPPQSITETAKTLEEKEKFLFKSKMQKQVTFLSNKELDVCYYIWKSYNSKQIAEILHMSHASARVIKNKVRQKLALNSSTELKPFLIEMVRE